mmetsp:Transcript_26136/g.31632  ORF Transcript_26136/g.31632 Transcript_26136/m.31632 type:complete len:92 (-) Transcript_26136:268-543(-)
MSSHFMHKVTKTIHAGIDAADKESSTRAHDKPRKKMEGKLCKKSKGKMFRFFNHLQKPDEREAGLVSYCKECKIMSDIAIICYNPKCRAMI